MKYTKLADRVPYCMGCKKPRDGTIVLAHRNLSGWGLRFGKGIKTIDLLGAFMCFECHTYGDGPGRRDHHWWELAVHRSINWSFENGYIQIGLLNEQTDD